MTEPTVRELVAQTRAALDAGDGEYAKMLFAALMELLVRKRNERFAQGDSLLPKRPFSERDLMLLTDARSCVRDAIDHAVDDVHSLTLSRYHQTKTEALIITARR